MNSSCCASRNGQEMQRKCPFGRWLQKSRSHPLWSCLAHSPIRRLLVACRERRNNPEMLIKCHQMLSQTRTPCLSLGSRPGYQYHGSNVGGVGAQHSAAVVVVVILYFYQKKDSLHRAKEKRTEQSAFSTALATPMAHGPTRMLVPAPLVLSGRAAHCSTPTPSPPSRPPARTPAVVPRGAILS